MLQHCSAIITAITCQQVETAMLTIGNIQNFPVSNSHEQLCYFIAYATILLVQLGGAGRGGGRISENGTFILLGKQAKENFQFSGRSRLAAFINLISITERCISLTPSKPNYSLRISIAKFKCFCFPNSDSINFNSE